MARKYLSGEELAKFFQLKNNSLPHRGGVKEFAPDGSWLEAKKLEAFYEERNDLLKEDRVKKKGNLARCNWRPELGLVEVTQDVGKFWDNMGHMEDGIKMLLPEEALFLLDAACIELYHGDVAWSYQEAFSTFIGQYIPQPRYLVYAHLCRLGYKLIRFQKSSVVTKYERQLRLDQYRNKKGSGSKSKRKNTADHNGNAVNKKNKLGDNVTDENTTKPELQQVTEANSEENHTESNLRDNLSAENMTTDDGKPSTGSTGKVIEEMSPVDETSCRDCNSSTGIAENCRSLYLNSSEQESTCSRSLNDQPKPTMQSTTETSELITKKCVNRTWFPLVKHRTENHLSLETLFAYSNWDFDVVKFPDVSSRGDCSECLIPDTRLVPTAVQFQRKENDLIFKAQKLEYQGEFSMGCGGWKYPSKSRNWGEYKREMQSLTQEDILKASPVSHYWEGDVIPLVRPTDATSTGDLLKKLKVIGNVNLTRSGNSTRKTTDNFEIAYDVFLPKSNFRKTCPGLPDFRLCIVSQEGEAANLSQIARLTRVCSDGVPLQWAVVDQGEVAVYSFNDVDLPRDISLG